MPIIRTAQKIRFLVAPVNLDFFTPTTHPDDKIVLIPQTKTDTLKDYVCPGT